jgi:hypothetical protein
MQYYDSRCAACFYPDPELPAGKVGDAPYVIVEKGKQALYVQLLMVLYRMLVASLLWYKKIHADLQRIGLKFNPYDGCVANWTIGGKQYTVRFCASVDNVMSSHQNKKVNDEFED